MEWNWDGIHVVIIIIVSRGRETIEYNELHFFLSISQVSGWREGSFFSHINFVFFLNEQTKVGEGPGSP